MSEDEFSDYTKDDVIKLMVERGATEDDAKTTATERSNQLDAALKILAQHSFNNISTAGPKVVVGPFHFRLRKAITNSIKLTSGLLTAGISLVAFPVLPLAAVGVVAGATSAVVTTIDTLSDMFTRMTDEELYVYESILDIATNDRHNSTNIAKNLTGDRLKQWFKEHYEAPPNHLDAILASMEKKGVLRKSGFDEEAKYSIVI
jgi:hypothetical protein